MRRSAATRISTLTWLALAGAGCREAAVSTTPEWRLSEQPTVTLGAGATAEHEFHRIAGAVRLPNGEIAVANEGTREVRYFRTDGTYLRAFGRQGEGPGEFQSMARLIRFGDTLAIHDSRTRRLTVFRGDSLLDTRMVRSSNAIRSFSIYGRLPDGRWVAVTGVSPQFSAQPYRDSIGVGIVPASGDGAVQWLGWFPGVRIVSLGQQVTGPAGFYTWVHTAIAGGQAVVLDGDQERLRRFSPDGIETPGGAIAIQGQPLSPEIIEQAKRREIDPRSDTVVQRQWLEVKYGTEVIGDRLPALRAMMADSEGRIWLEGYRADESRPGRYFVYSLEAKPVATVAVPGGFRATDIGADYVLGVVTDADGIERVVMYRLIRR